jgi:iron complex outermembrane receptor protein
MNSSITRRRLLASTMIGGALSASLAASAAFAQTPPEPPPDQPTAVDEIVVTGSRIPQPNLKSVSPITVVGAQDIQTQGVTRTEDLINQLPQVFAAQGSAYANAATGTATIDLRGLGPSRTLVLIDGRRLMAGDPSSGATNTAPDLNFIPATLIDRVELVTGGASAVYGSDAVAGVVNFIMQKNFEGVRLDGQYSLSQHENNDGTIQDIVRSRAATAFNPASYSLPKRHVNDGDTVDLNLVIGANTPDGKGNVTAYVGYRNVDAVLQSNRDFSACNLQSTPAAPGGYTCAGSGTTNPVDLVTGGGAGDQFTLDPAVPGGRAFRPYVTDRDAFNFAPYNYFQRPDERYILGAFGHYEINPHAEVYAQLMFMDDRTVAQIAPSGIFGQNINVNCVGPLLSAAQAAVACDPTIDQVPDDPAFPSSLGVQTDADPGTPGQQASLAILRRNEEGGGRQADLRHTDYRGVLGLRGDLGDGFTYDVYAQYGTVVYAQTYLNDFSLSRAQRALDVITDPTTGQPACRSAVSAAAGGTGLDLNCVPYDIFSLGGVTPAALTYLQTPGFQSGSIKQTVVSGSVSGDLGQYGVRSPWANDGVGMAVGAEYRRESLELRTDVEYQTGDLTGQGGATLPSQGAYDLYELFGELRVPIAQDKPFLQSLSAELGYRYSDYSLGFNTGTYKIAGDWNPITDLRLRASRNRAIRAPNIVELFSTRNVVLNGSTDPCEGDDPAASFTECARTGVTAAQYGNIAANQAGQYNGQIGGNPNVEPETSDTTSIGAVFTPSFLSRFTLSVDWYNIKVKDRIGQIGQDVTISRCAETGDPFFCGLIHRAPGTGSLWLSPSGFIVDTTFNTGKLEVEGVDIEANYRFDFSDFGMTSGLGKYGGLSFNFIGSKLDHYLITTLPGDPAFDCAGLYGSVCTGTAVPTAAPLVSWRHKFRVTWQAPWNLQVSGTWRHLDSIDIDATNPDTGAGASHIGSDSTLASQDYFDLSAIWGIRDKTSIRFGINNIFDKDPPIAGSGAGAINNCPTGPCSGNTYPQTYDALGRYVFLGARMDF